MNNILKRLTNTRKKKVIGAIVLIIILIFVIRMFSSDDQVEIEDKAPKSVEVNSVYNIVNDISPLPLIGKVESQSEAIVRTESQGEISYVRKSLGDKVYAGETIAEIKNASQRADVLRAQGVLQSAKAGLSKVSGGSNEARNTIINSINNAFITSDDAVKNKVDQFITNPNSSNPEVTVASSSPYTRKEVEDQRKIIGKLLTEWQNSIVGLSSIQDPTILETKFREAETNLQKVQSFLEVVATDVNTFTTRINVTQTEINKWKSDVSTARSSVNASLSSLISTFNTYGSQIGIGEQGQDIQVAEAQVTQALAGLYSAQAALDKTVIKSPINGAINALSIKQGDLVASFQEVAEVVGGGELEIVAYISESDRTEIKVGSNVSIEGGNAGVISRIAPGVNSQNQKVEIRISVIGENNLKNGQSVSLDIERNIEDRVEVKTISIPLSALKISSTTAYVYQVDENNKIVQKEVVPGSIIGENILILEGLTLEDQIVIDLRGLKDGQEVTVK